MTYRVHWKKSATCQHQHKTLQGAARCYLDTRGLHDEWDQSKFVAWQDGKPRVLTDAERQVLYEVLKGS